MIDPSTSESLSSLSENSFVILGQGSLSALVNDNLTANEDAGSWSKGNTECNIYNPTDSNIFNKFESKLSKENMSQEEIQVKLDDLIKENSLLKETLSQNNLAIKSQLDTFILWQQEVLKIHDTHKQKFLETKDLILKFREENLNLKKQLQSSLGVPVINEKPEDSVYLKQKIVDYEKMCSSLNEKNQKLDDENQKLKEELKKGKMEIWDEIWKSHKESEDVEMFLKEKNYTLNKNSPKDVYQISNLFKHNKLQKGKILKLAEELGKNEPENFNKCVGKTYNMLDSFDVENGGCSGLESLISLPDGSLEEIKFSEGIETNLVDKTHNLKSHLNEEESIFREKQESLLKLKMQFHKLLEDYKALQLKITSIESNDSDIEKYKEENSSLLNRLEARDKELIAKQQECDDLKRALQKLNLELEEIAILRVQVELYESDFYDERTAKEKLARENEEMAEQIQSLQSVVNALQGENLKNNNSGSPLESSGKKSKYRCPRCVNSFFDFNNFEAHIEECFVSDNFL